jgi:hypothetical protein
MGSRRHLAALVLILVAALWLRTYGLQRLVYANPDEALFSYFIVTTAQLSPTSPHPADNSLARIMSWDYGYPLFVVDDVYVRVLEALRLPVSEATLPLPLVVLGVLSCLLVYLIARRMAAGPVAHGATPAALIAAALMAVMPFMVGWSRSIGGTIMANGFLLLLAVLQLMRYWERPEDRRRQWLAGLCVGLYLAGDVQFLIGGAVLLGFVLLWPRVEGHEGWRGLGRMVWRPGFLIPPLVLFLPYVPAWLYAIKLGYPDQTYLGTVFAEHQADWGFHLAAFAKDLARNMGLLPAYALMVALPWIVGKAWNGGPADSRPLRTADARRLRWLLVWIALAALPFLVAVTGEITQAAGYHEHLVAALAIALGLALGPVRPAALGRGLAGVVVVGALLVTLGGVFRVAPLIPLWPDTKIPYGGMVPNSGMKTAGYWVRQNVARDAPIFVAHDPAVAYWYMGRECITGGMVLQKQRKQALLDSAARVSAAVIPGPQDDYPPALMRQLGFTGRVVVHTRGVEVLDIYTRQGLTRQANTGKADYLYNRTYRTSRAIIPPPWPYAPGKAVGATR